MVSSPPQGATESLSNEKLEVKNEDSDLSEVDDCDASKEDYDTQF